MCGAGIDDMGDRDVGHAASETGVIVKLHSTSQSAQIAAAS